MANSTSGDTIAFSSSRGPVLIDGSGRIKPDVAAPGTGIYSSISGGGYGTLSGTSMAGPHVVGLAALLLSVKPNLVGQVDEVEQLIASSAVPLIISDSCGGIPGNEYPNNSAGWGRIDALKAYLYLQFKHYLPWISKESSSLD